MRKLIKKGRRNYSVSYGFRCQLVNFQRVTFLNSYFSKHVPTFPNSDFYEHEFSVVYPTLCSTSTNAGSGEATNRKPRCETKYLFAVGTSH